MDLVTLLVKLIGEKYCGIPTLWVELKYVNVALRVCDYDIQLLSIRKKVGCYDFEVLYILAEQSHLIWLLLDGHIVSNPLIEILAALGVMPSSL